MKKRLTDLNDHLFAQLERLGDEDLTADDIAKEAQRAEAMVKVSDQIIDSNAQRIAAARLFADHGDRVLHMLPLIGAAQAKPIGESDT